MPSSATITAFYNFTANTKARASHVNTNFDVYRGHVIPIEPLTATSADNSYDLGSTEYRWRTAYLGTARFGATTTAYSSLEADTASGDLIVKVGGSESARFKNAGQFTFTSEQVQTIITATSYQAIAGSTITIATNGRPIEYGLIPPSSYSSSIASVLTLQTTTNTASMFAYVGVFKNTTTSQIGLFQYRNFPQSSSGETNDYAVTEIRIIDDNPGTTSNTYFVMAYKTNTTFASFSITEYRAYAKRTL